MALKRPAESAFNARPPANIANSTRDRRANIAFDELGTGPESLRIGFGRGIGRHGAVDGGGNEGMGRSKKR